MPVAEYFVMPDGKIPRSEAEVLYLQEVLASRVRAGGTECAEAMRELVDTVTIFRDPSRLGGVEVEIAR